MNSAELCLAWQGHDFGLDISALGPTTRLQITLEANKDLTRQAMAARFDQDPLLPRIQESLYIVLGMGAVGSYLTPLLAKTMLPLSPPPYITLFDFDRVDAPNMGTQNFTPEDLGHSKVAAVKYKIWHFTSQLASSAARFEDDPLFRDMARDTRLQFRTYFVLLDSMSSRYALVKHLQQLRDLPIRLVDVRTGWDFIEAHTLQGVTSEVLQDYEATLFNDDDIQPAPCGLQTHPGNGIMAAAFGYNAWRALLSGSPTKYRALSLSAMTLFG